MKTVFTIEEIGKILNTALEKSKVEETGSVVVTELNKANNRGAFMMYNQAMVEMYTTAERGASV